MPKTKEEKAAYFKEYRVKNKDKIKEYNQTRKRIKTGRIYNWKSQKIRVPNNDWDTFYNYYLDINNCKYCNVEMTYDLVTTRTRKTVHHDHEIEDKDAPNFICICCNACNSERQLSNTSGEVNIYYRRSSNKWDFKKIIDGVKYYEGGFKTKEEAIAHKISVLSKVIKVGVEC